MSELGRIDAWARTVWETYKTIRQTKPEMAEQLWSLIRENFEIERREAIIRSNNDTELRRYNLKRLQAVQGAKFDLATVLTKTGMLSDTHGLHAVLSEPKVNYHGHLCGTVVDEKIKILAWDEAEGAYRVTERSTITITAFLTTTLDGQPKTRKSSEMEVVGGVERPVVPFQVEVEGYPLRFLERSRYEKLQVPAKGRSEVMRFPIHPESLIHRPGETNRVPVWINCRQHNSLVQCVCVPLLIVPKTKPKKATREKSK